MVQGGLGQGFGGGGLHGAQRGGTRMLGTCLVEATYSFTHADPLAFTPSLPPPITCSVSCVSLWLCSMWICLSTGTM